MLFQICGEFKLDQMINNDFLFCQNLIMMRFELKPC